MRVLILSLGTRGDVEVFLTLAGELLRRGNEVTVAASPFYEPPAGRLPASWLPIGAGTQAELTAIIRSLADIDDKRQRVRRYAEAWIRPQLAAGQDSLKAAIHRCDYFINNLRSVWQREGRIVPGAEVTYDPPADIHRLAEYPSHRPENAAAILQLVAMNRALVDPDHAWPADYHFTGFWAPAPREVQPVPPQVHDLLQQGIRPVVLTMGSMVMFDRDQLLSEFAAALAELNLPGIALTSWAGTPPRCHDVPNFVVADELPYDWLFPQAACVLHHGGCGTVGLLLRAGVPAVLFPQISSQEHFAALLERQGLIGGILDCRRPDRQAIAAAIRRALAQDVRTAAAEWQTHVAADPGVTQAADLIEQHAQGLGLLPKV